MMHGQYRIAGPNPLENTNGRDGLGPFVAPYQWVHRSSVRRAMSATHERPAIDGAHVPGYEILRTLGTGGMGRVLLARQKALNRLVCMKVMAIPDGIDAKACQERFYREAELLASVSHPHILSIFDFGTTPERHSPFLVTEFIEGGDLRARMTAGEAMPLPQVRSIVRQVGDALAHLHGKGILHRDLKPENILTPTDSLVKVGDFGIAVPRDQVGSLTRSGVGIGTVGYISPEQQYGLPLDERTDEYSLAALCYELLTGRLPLGSFASPSHWNARLTPEVDAVIRRGLAEEPKNRYATVADFVGAFDRALVQAGRRHRWRRPLRIAAGLVATALGLVWWLSLRGQDVSASNRRLSSSGVDDRGRSGALPRQRETVPAPTAATAVAGSSDKKPETAAPELTPQRRRLVSLRAYAIWVARGRPTGPPGEVMEKENWAEAERQIDQDIKARAYELWVRQGRPEGAAGVAVSEKNMMAAESELLREMENEMDRHPLD